MILVFDKYCKIFIVLFVFLFIEGCAHSAASRGAQTDADQVYLSADYAMRNMDAVGFHGTIQNANQETKGIVLGGVLGAAAGSATSGIGGAAGFGLGAVFGGAIGSYIDSHTTLKDQLENRQARVIVLGDQVMIVINSAQLFYENTANLRVGSYDLLTKVAEFIGQYPNRSVKIVAYTSSVEAQQVVMMLTKQQADNVMKFLWGQNINTRLLYAEGAGGTKLVTANTNNWSSDNYRVEITFEKLPV